ncbi:MAG: hypothetical protein M1838_001839 [Thelocarpon superellum]|nr:MAG: hypothetical protein M1838_001839 [Thelocarpon superellum]
MRSMPINFMRRGIRGPNAGAIAGGVIGGVVLIALITFLVYKYCIKTRRLEYEEDDGWIAEHESREKSSEFLSRRDDRASMHTVGSIASTVFTRASNVIQIAYIPGVTNRSPPSTPGVLIPPVPPLPFGSDSNSSASTPSEHQDQHFFMPDLRASTYSSDDKHRASVAPSLGRSSVATTIYRNNAVIDTVPQKGIRGKAAVVSVKSSNQNSPDSTPPPTPPLPALNHEKYGPIHLSISGATSPDHLLAPPSPAFSVGSTLMNGTANTAKAVTARPVMVSKSKNILSTTTEQTNLNNPYTASSYRDTLPRMSVATTASSSSRHSRARRTDKNLSVFDDISSDEEPGTRARKSWREEKRASQNTITEESERAKQSPFSDNQSTTKAIAAPRNLARIPQNQKPAELNLPAASHMAPTTASVSQAETSTKSATSGETSVSQAIEEATRRASRNPTHGGLGGVTQPRAAVTTAPNAARDPSPFSDVNEVK